MLNIKRLLNTDLGRVIISILLGIGLATLFRKACTDKNCIEFNGPVISEVDGKTYKFGEACYLYNLTPTKCDPTKKTVEINDAVANSVVPVFSSTTTSSNGKSWFGW
jgi:hypothetical protein